MSLVKAWFNWGLLIHTARCHAAGGPTRRVRGAHSGGSRTAAFGASRCKQRSGRTAAGTSADRRRPPSTIETTHPRQHARHLTQPPCWRCLLSRRASKSGGMALRQGTLQPPSSTGKHCDALEQPAASVAALKGVVVSWDSVTATGYAEVAGVGLVPIDGCDEVLVNGDLIRLTLGTSARELIGKRPCKVGAALAKPSTARRSVRLRPLLVKPSFVSADAAAHLLEPPVDEEQLEILAAFRVRHAALRSRGSYLEAVSKHATQQLCSLSSEHEAMSRPRLVWLASAAQAADGPWLAGARGSMRHALALKDASGEPAGRGMRR